jgi:hypothetical protein
MKNDTKGALDGGIRGDTCQVDEAEDPDPQAYAKHFHSGYTTSTLRGSRWEDIMCSPNLFQFPKYSSQKYIRQWKNISLGKNKKICKDISGSCRPNPDK